MRISTVAGRQRRRQWHPTPVLLPGKSHGWRSLVGCSPWGREESDMSDFTFTFHFHALEKEMATHSSVLAWRIPDSGSLVGCSLWGCEESDTTERLYFHFSLSCTGEGNGNPLLFLPGEFQGQGNLVGFHPWGRTESDMTEVT